jgi:hypothetical protein
MKSASVSVLLCALLATASPLEKRQSALADLINTFPPSYIINPASKQAVTPRLRTTATRQLIRYGPFKLPANKGSEAKPAAAGHGGHGGMGGSAKDGKFNPLEILTGQKPMDPNGFSTMRILSNDSFCQDCTVLAGKLDVVFENGTRADISGGVYLHHVITVDLTKNNKKFMSGCAPAQQGKAGGNLAGLNTFIGGAVVSLKPLAKQMDRNQAD